MAQRNRNGRGGVRGGVNDGAAEQALWAELRDSLPTLQEMLMQSQRTADDIAALMTKLSLKEERGEVVTIQEQDTLQALFRKQIKEVEDAKLFAESDEGIPKLRILKALQQANEEQLPSRGSNSRESHSRGSVFDDGMRDSPERPLDTKTARKLGAGPPSSQPPKERKDQSEEREAHASLIIPNRPNTKITFALGAQVAFKPKTVVAGTEHDWIQGIVAKVIGEGKSRRYDVQDPYPEQGKVGMIHRTSASSMVPIPAMGSSMPPYEGGRVVLALYPDTTTFYRAEVVEMVDEGAKVKLVFEDDEPGAFKQVERRFVLDHKGV